MGGGGKVTLRIEGRSCGVLSGGESVYIIDEKLVEQLYIMVSLLFLFVFVLVLLSLVSFLSMFTQSRLHD